MSNLPIVDTVLDDTNFVYTRMVAIAWTANKLLQPTLLTSDAGAALLQCVIGRREEVPIVISCKGISTVEDHALSDFRNYIDSTRRAAIFIVPASQEQLAREIESELKSTFKATHRVNDMYAQIYGNGTIPLEQVSALIDNSLKLEQNYVHRIIKESYRPFPSPERLESTPLIASGVLNARSLISDPKKFIWISLLLTDLFQAAVNEAKPRTVRILAVSLRGSPFAAAVRVLSDTLSPTLEIVDHIGPRHEVLEDHAFLCESKGGEYIFIGDFVIGGTEIKIARAYALSKGAKLNNAIAIGSFLSPELYSQTVTLKPLIKIPDIVPELTYEFRP